MSRKRSPRKDAPRAGRPRLPGGREPFTTTLPPHVKRWLQRDGNASAQIVRLVEGEIAREKAATG